MESLHRLWRRLRLLIRRRRVDAATDDEMQYHIESQAAELIAAGLPPDEARRQARRAFGNIGALKDEARDARGVTPVEDLARDLRYAFRVLWRNPGFALAAGLTFALGIGATTAIFSIVYGVVLRPLPYAEPARLVALWEHHIPRNRDQNVVSVDNFEAWRERATAFSGMAALVPRPTTLTGTAGAERAAGAEVSAGYFNLLGVAPAMGRGLRPNDASEVVLSDAFWRRHFAADPAVVGRTLQVADEPYTIVGVMPAGFEPPAYGWLGRQDLWFPFVSTPQNRAWGRFLLVVARLKPGVTLERAREELRAIAEQRQRESPNNEGWSASIVPLREQIAGDARAPLLSLMAGVGVLLALAVVNVGALTVSMMRRREQELSVRRALGASDGRIARQLFVQSALVAALGGVVGLLTAVPGLQLLVALLPPELPRSSSIALDLPVLAISTGVAMLATIAVGVAAAMRGRSGVRPLTDFASAGGRTTGRAGGAVLVPAEIALGLALSIVALLMVRSFDALRSVDLGFGAESVVAARLALSDRYEGAERERAFFAGLVQRLQQLPMVADAGIVSSRPFSGSGPATYVFDARQPKPGSADLLTADGRYVDAGFFTTLRIPLLAGRLFPAGSSDGAPDVVINQRLAQSLWPRGDAIGQQLTIGFFDGITATVIGVVGDVHLMDARTPPRGTIYLSAARFPSDTRDILLRASGDTGALIQELRAVLKSIDPALPLYQVVPLEQLVDESLARDRFTAFLLAAFAGCALMLAGVGVTAVFAGDVAARRREIAVRMALGAKPSRVAALILRRSFTRALVGAALGSVLALALVRPMASLLFRVTPGDPTTFAAAAAAVLILACVATLLPTYRALLRSPLAALREG